MAHLEVDLVAADRKVWSGEATAVSAPAADGEIGILPGHAPVLTLLRPGTIRIAAVDGDLRAVRVDSGFLSVDNNRVTLVVHRAEAADAVPAPTAGF